MSKKNGEKNGEKVVRDLETGKPIAREFVAEYPLKSVTVDPSFNGRLGNGTEALDRKSDEHDSSLEDLTNDIKKRGVLMPIWVSKSGFLFAGFRRVEAAKKAGLTSIPAFVYDVPREKEQAAMRTFNVVENVHRDNYKPCELSYQLLKLQKEEESLPTMGDLADFVGLTQSYVSKLVKIADKLKHPPVVKAWKNDTLTVAEADQFASHDREGQAELWEARVKANEEKLSDGGGEGGDPEKKRKKKRKPAEINYALANLEHLSEIKVGSQFLAISDIVGDEQTVLNAISSTLRWASGDLVKDVFRFDIPEEADPE